MTQKTTEERLWRIYQMTCDARASLATIAHRVNPECREERYPMAAMGFRDLMSAIMAMGYDIEIILTDGDEPGDVGGLHVHDCTGDQ